MYAKTKWLLAGAAGLTALVIILVLASQVHRAQAAEHTLAETTLASLSDAAEEVQGLALAMDKLRIAASGGQTASLLHETVLRADRARHSLSALPADPLAIAPVLAYLSRLSAAAGTLLTQMGGGLPVTSGEIADLASAQSNLTLLHAELDLALEALLGGSDLTAALPPTAITVAPAAAELASYRALPSEEVSSGMALLLAKEFVGAARVTSIAPASNLNGALPAYGVTVRTADLQLHLEVTRRGGKVLLMSPETAGFSIQRTVDECSSAASDFLSSRGFGSMAPAYYQIHDGLCVLTFAHIQGGALVWPDRVTVQVRMDTAEVVGLEARSYWENHMPRKLGKPLLSADEARTALSGQAQEQSVRLAVLPVGTQERLCWQFTLTHNDDTYISFIDATTGRELLLEKMMQLEYGSIPA